MISDNLEMVDALANQEITEYNKQYILSGIPEDLSPEHYKGMLDGIGLVGALTELSPQVDIHFILSSLMTVIAQLINPEYAVDKLCNDVDKWMSESFDKFEGNK